MKIENDKNFITININASNLKAFCRGEIDFDYLFKDLENNQIYTFALDGEYKITILDFIYALKTFRNDNKSAENVIYDYFFNLCYTFREISGVLDLIGVDQSDKDFYWENSEKVLIPANTKEACFNVVYDFYMFYETRSFNFTQKEFNLLLDEYILSLEYAVYNENKPFNEMKLTLSQKRDYLLNFERNIAYENEETKKIFRLFLEELCSFNDTTALTIKGYACYGNNDFSIYGCDYNVSKDCFLKLFELGDDEQKARSANSLGYIYYYGRCNDGNPDYENAYKYFSYASFAGFIEATYKIGDMLLAGKGSVPKNEKAAFYLYNKTFYTTLSDFLYGINDTPFSDCALRMGKLYENGIYVEKDLEKALSFYQKAKFSSKKRLQENSFFGYQSVSLSIDEAITRVKNKLNENAKNKLDFNAKKHYLSQDEIISLFYNMKKLKLKITKKKNCYKLDFIRTKKHSFSNQNNLLYSMPLIDFCEIIKRISFYAPLDTKITLKNNEEINLDKKDTFYIDDCFFSSNCIFFLSKDKVILTLDTNEIFYDNEKRQNKLNRTVRLASVVFEPLGKNYDYICENKEIVEGDLVKVKTYRGECTVKIVKIREEKVKDLFLPLKRYKKIDICDKVDG